MDALKDIIIQLERQLAAIEQALAALREIEGSAPVSSARAKGIARRKRPVKSKRGASAGMHASTPLPGDPTTSNY